MKQIILETKFLSNPYTGIYIVTTYYTDGTSETHEAPLGPIFIPKSIDVHTGPPDVPKNDSNALEKVFTMILFLFPFIAYGVLRLYYQR